MQLTPKVLHALLVAGLRFDINSIIHIHTDPFGMTNSSLKL